MKQTQYKLEDLKVGQKVKVLVDLGTYISDLNFSRIGQEGVIAKIDDRSVKVVFDTHIFDDCNYSHDDQWYAAEEIKPAITTNAERQEEISRLETEIQTLNSEVVKLKKEIKANPEKIKAEAGDSVRFKYHEVNNGEWLYMYIMTKEQVEFFGGWTHKNFHFQGPGGCNDISVANNGSWTKLELRKKNECEWIDSEDVDWSGIMK